MPHKPLSQPADQAPTRSAALSKMPSEPEKGSPKPPHLPDYIEPGKPKQQPSRSRTTKR